MLLNHPSRWLSETLDFPISVDFIYFDSEKSMVSYFIGLVNDRYADCALISFNGIKFL